MNNGHSLFLDRLANEQLVTPPPSSKSASLLRHGSPFRMKKQNKSVSSHSRSKTEEDNNIFGIVDDEDDSFASSSAFRSFIRMQTQNYQLASSLSLSTHAAEGGVRATRAAASRDAGVEEFMEEQPQDESHEMFSTPSPTDGVCYF